MTIIRIEPYENGAHANQTINGTLSAVPEGWAVVPPELEAAAASYMPWVRLAAADGVVTSLTLNEAARAAFEATLENEEEVEA